MLHEASAETSASIPHDQLLFQSISPYVLGSIGQSTPLQEERKTRFNRPEILGRKYFDFARANLVKEGQRMCWSAADARGKVSGGNTLAGRKDTEVGCSS